MSVSDLNIKEKLENVMADQKDIFCYGMGDGLDKVRDASRAEKNLVLSPSGIKAAEYLKERFGTPYEIGYPLASEFLKDLEHLGENVTQKILIVHQQVFANEMRNVLRKRLGENADIDVASFFMLKPELKEEGDLILKEEADLIKLAEEGGYTLVIGDSIIKSMFADDISFIDIPHFACSGRLCEA